MKTKKTLADFKRDIDTGLHIEYVKNEERAFNYEKHTHEGAFHPTEIPDRMRGIRFVSYVDTTGFYLKKKDDITTRGSFCGFPKATDLQYDGENFTITDRAQSLQYLEDIRNAVAPPPNHTVHPSPAPVTSFICTL